MATDNRLDLAGPGIMLLSAAIFGYFGFFTGMTATTSTGERVLFFAILLWTLRIGAILFALSAVIAMVQPMAGNALYALAGLGTALGLVAVGVMDLMDDQRAAAIPPILAFIFAAWNGYGSWSSLSQILSARQAGHDRSSPPEERR